jgi:hypothetical protein
VSVFPVLINIADEQAAEAQAQAQAYAADLVANRKRYVYENAFILLCDMLSGQTTHTKLDEDVFPVAMATLKAQNESAFDNATDMFTFLDSRLSKLAGPNWWDTCVYRDVPELVTPAQTLIGMFS